MRRHAARLSLAALLGLSGPCEFGSAAAQETDLPAAPVVATFGAWAVQCERTVGVEVDACAATQTATQAGGEGTGDLVLTVFFVRADDGAIDVLRVLAPLGVLLPSGLSLSVDGKEVGVAGFVRCLPPGCISEVALGEGLRAQLVAGRTAEFAVSLTPRRQASVRIPLDGLGAALRALATASAERGGGAEQRSREVIRSPFAGRACTLATKQIHSRCSASDGAPCRRAIV